MVLALLSHSSTSIAQHESEEPVLQEVRAAVARKLGLPTDIAFEGLRLIRDNLGTLVCGTVNGKRFLAGPADKPPPQIEGALNVSVFNYLWNARCKGMSASAADEVFGRELK